jgi:hypothetical protein
MSAPENLIRITVSPRLAESMATLAGNVLREAATFAAHARALQIGRNDDDGIPF